MIQRLYYRGIEIDYINRIFTFNNTLMADIVMNGKSFIVKRADLLEANDFEEEIIEEKSLLSKINEIDGSLKINGSEIEFNTPEFTTTPESNEPSTETPPAEEVISEEIVVEKNEKSVSAKRLSNNRVTKLGEKDSDTYINFLKRNKLDPKAVENVLLGKNKTHKGYEFYYA